MKPQSVQPPNFRDNYTLTLTPDELSLLKTALIEHLAHGDRDQDILDALYSKLQLTLSSSDGACLRPAQPLEAVEQGGTNVALEIYQSIFESSKSLFNVIDNLLDSIPVGNFKERCRELRTAVSLVFHFHMDRSGDDCLHSAQSFDPVPLQRSRVDFSLRPYSCGFCGMYHRKEQSCMPDIKPRDSEKGLLGFHEFYGPSYHAEDFDIDEFVFDYLTSPYVGNGVRS